MKSTPHIRSKCRDNCSLIFWKTQDWMVCVSPHGSPLSISEEVTASAGRIGRGKAFRQIFKVVLTKWNKTLFTTSAITHYHKLRGLSQHKCTILTVLGVRSLKSFSWLQARCWQGWFLVDPLKENQFCRLFLVWTDCLLPLAHGLILLSLQPLISVVTSPTADSAPLPPLRRIIVVALASPR